MQRVREVFPSVQLATTAAYGLTESGGSVTAVSGPEYLEHPGSAGRPFAICELSILNPDSAGQGEILVRTPSAMSGYWGLPDDSIMDKEGWIHTGDLGHIDADGHLYVTGRSKDIIIRGGENVAASRVEECILRHPSVAEAAVVGLEHADLGEEVSAVIVLRPSASLTAEELHDFVSPFLAYFEVPTRWWIRREPLPTTASGKFLKKQLRQQWPGDGVRT
jgi:long-chain acyl-CoA synthetase